MDFRLTLTGTAPLLMHNGRLANPLDPATRAIKPLSGKRGKTDEDHEALARMEHAGSLYLDPDVGPFLPGESIVRSLAQAGAFTKKGRAVTRGVFIKTDVNPLSYQGPRDADSLWTDENFRLIAGVVIGGKRVMRCRPIFRSWKTEADGFLDEAVLNFAELQDIAATAGQLIGVGDWRPRYGRFTVTAERL